jgi:hypothetical protein
VGLSNVFINGWGAVSPAGWGVKPLVAAVTRGEPLPGRALPCPSAVEPLIARMIPVITPPPAYLLHPRLRRASAISRFTVAAAQEALGTEPTHGGGRRRMGIILGVQAGAITYSERFFAEVVQDPATASPMLFPETVFNAPISHLAAWLGGATATFALIGDKTAFIQALAVGAGWLVTDRVDECLVIGAEEAHWPIADAARLFDRAMVCGEGAGALHLSRQASTPKAVRLECITDAHLHAGHPDRGPAARRMRGQLPADAVDELLVDSCGGAGRSDRAELEVWRSWPGLRSSPRAVLGEALSAGTAWQCVLACETLAAGRAHAANVSVVGFNQCAIGARLVAEPPH